MWRLLALPGLLAASLVSGLGPTASANDCDRVGAGAAGFIAQTCVRQSPSISPGDLTGETAVGTNSVTYYYAPLCERGGGITGDDFFGCGGQVTCAENGLMFTLYADRAGQVSSQGSFCLEPQEAAQVAPPPQVTPGLVAAAFRRIPLPESSVAVAPPGGRTLVGLETVLWTQAEPFTEVVTLLGQRVELEIEPASYSWSHGDGTGQETASPGVAYAEGRPFSDYVTHAYTRTSGRVPLSVDTTWSARFRVGGGPWREVGETVTIEGDPVPIAVVEAEPNLVGY